MPGRESLRSPLDAVEHSDGNPQCVGPGLGEPGEPVGDDGAGQHVGEVEGQRAQQGEVGLPRAAEGPLRAGDGRPAALVLGLDLFSRVADVHEESVLLISIKLWEGERRGGDAPGAFIW